MWLTQQRQHGDGLAPNKSTPIAGIATAIGSVIFVVLVSLLIFRVRRPRVFVSYTAANESAARVLVASLRRNAVETLFIPMQVRPQDHTVLDCIASMQRSDMVIILIDEAPSAWQTAEWFAAIYGDKVILVFASTGDNVLRARTSLSGYPTFAYSQAGDVDVYGSIVKAFHGSWVELAKPALNFDIVGGASGCAALVALVLKHASTHLLWIWPAFAAHYNKVRAAGQWLVATVVMIGAVLVLIRFGQNVFRVYVALRTISRQNRQRTTTRAAVDALVAYCRYPDAARKLILDPEVVASEIPQTP